MKKPEIRIRKRPFKVLLSLCWTERTRIHQNGVARRVDLLLSARTFSRIQEPESTHAAIQTTRATHVNETVYKSSKEKDVTRTCSMT
jgi:hypothetical protein